MSGFTQDDDDMLVTKRDGREEVISFDKISKRIKKLGQEANIKVNFTALVMKVIDQLHPGIHTTKIDELSAEQCASMSSIHPDYSILAGRITVSNHHKNTEESFNSVIDQLYKYKDKLKNKNVNAYKHKSFWMCMDTLRDKILLEKIIKKKFF